MPSPPYCSSKKSPKMSFSRKSSTTSHGNSCVSSISAARGAIRSRASLADEIAQLALLVGQDVPGHGAESTARARSQRALERGRLGDLFGRRGPGSLECPYEPRAPPWRLGAERFPRLGGGRGRVALGEQQLRPHERMRGPCELRYPAELAVATRSRSRAISCRRDRRPRPTSRSRLPGPPASLGRRSRGRRKRGAVRLPVREAASTLPPQRRDPSPQRSRGRTAIGWRIGARRRTGKRVRSGRRARGRRRSDAKRTTCEQPAGGGPAFRPPQGREGRWRSRRPSRPRSGAPQPVRTRPSRRRPQDHGPRPTPPRVRARRGSAQARRARR